MKDNLNPQALNIAMEKSLRFKKENLALELFKAAKQRGLPIRSHYFWPLLVARGKANDTNGTIVNYRHEMNQRRILIICLALTQVSTKYSTRSPRISIYQSLPKPFVTSSFRLY